MKKLLTSLVLVLVLCLACSIAFAAEDANVVGESYETITIQQHGDGTKETFKIPKNVETWTDAQLLSKYGTDSNGIANVMWVGKKPTCTAGGVLQIPCQLEPGRKHTVTINKTIDHDWREEIADCLRTRTCKVCGFTKTEEHHTWSSDTGDLNWGKVTAEFSCTEGGKAQDYCIKCGKLNEKYRTIEPLDHNFGIYEIVSLPHCVMGEKGEEYKTVDGKVQLVCTRCGVAAVDGNWWNNGVKIAKEDLAKDIKVDKDYNITIGGVAWDSFTNLKKADIAKLKNTKYPAAYHDFDGWVTSKAATCTDSGVKTHWCNRCGATYNAVIAPLGHDFVERETLKNCFISQTDYVCSRCNALLNGDTFKPIIDAWNKSIEQAYDTYIRNAVEPDRVGYLSKVTEIEKAIKDFETKYAKFVKEPNQTAVVAHEYEEKSDWLITKSNAASFGLNYDDVYSGEYSDKATCTKAKYEAYACIHFKEGAVGLFGEMHDAKHGIFYKKVQEKKGHTWGPWQTIYEPGQGDNVKGYYARQCSVCEAWENRQTTDDTEIEDTKAAGFVVRLFKALLGEDDVAPARVYEWSDGLEDGTSTAADVVKGFVGSDAFAKKYSTSEEDPHAMDNASIVKALYKALLNRDADAEGLKTWTDQLNNGASLNAVINGFTTSEEFKEFAEKSGFEAGQVAPETRDVNPRVTAFVERCYTVALERVGEAEGVNYWTNELLSGAQSPKQVAAGFVFSKEYDAAAKIADEETVEGVVEDLYKLYLGRGASETEKAWYVDLLNNGMKLEELNTMFADSVEFANIVSSYGLNPNL